MTNVTNNGSISLTQMEKVALAELYESSAANGHDFGFPDELPSIPKASRGGVVGSLAKKGLIDVHEGEGRDLCTQFTFTEIGLSIAASIKSDGTKAHTVIRYSDGIAIGRSKLTAEQFRHYEAMAQQPEGIIRLGALPHDYYDLDAEYQDESENATVYLD